MTPWACRAALIVDSLHHFLTLQLCTRLNNGPNIRNARLLVAESNAAFPLAHSMIILVLMAVGYDRTGGGCEDEGAKRFRSTVFRLIGGSG